jgi:hypothetical protein
MGSKAVAGRSFELRLLWIAFGIALEFLIIPDEIRRTSSVLHHDNIFASRDFYYVLISPFVVWWFFRRLVPSKEGQLGQNGVRLMNCLFAFYAATLIRAIFEVFFAIHLGIWAVTRR